jgi:hypothetical protein
VERRGPELLDTWRRWSPPQQGGGVHTYWIHGGTGALLNREARSGAAGHMMAPETSSTERRGSELQDTRHHVKACLAPCLELMPVCGGIRCAGYRHK